MVQVGDRVLLTGMTARGYTGTVTQETEARGQKRFVVTLDSPFLGRHNVTVTWRRLRRLEPERFISGQRVAFATRLFQGHTGTLIRPSRLLWKRAWIVHMDAPLLGRTRVTERALVRLDDAASSDSSP